MSNTMIVEFAHRRIHELHEEIRDMENIIKEYTPHEDDVISIRERHVVPVNGIGWKNGVCIILLPWDNMSCSLP